MKVIIAGGRDFVPSISDVAFLDKQKESLPITEVVCGMARGADLFGKAWAGENKIPVKEFPADWKKYGKSAGPIRNQQMAEYADALIAFPGGRGTDDMITRAKAQGLKTRILYQS